MTDPVQVVADAIRSTYFRPGDDLAEQAADLAVAALKANPKALAALLVRSGIAYRSVSDEWVPLVEYPRDGREKVDLYRLPDPS